MSSWMFLLLIFGFSECGNFSFVQISDTHFSSSSTEAEEYLREIVIEVNSKIEEFNIKFAIVNGDITDYGNPEEYRVAREELDKLEIPYFPLIGNHDVYGPGDKDRKPTGENTFRNTFSDKYHSNEYVTRYTGDIPIKNPVIGSWPSYFQNSVIEYDRIVLILLDFCNRKPHILFTQMARPGTNVHDFEGGTWNFLKSVIENVTSRIDEIDKISLAFHQPFKNPIYAPVEWMFSWEQEDRIRFRDFLIDMDSRTRKKIFGSLNGHLHFQSDRKPFDGFDFREICCDAAKNGVIYQIIEVGEDGEFTITDIGDGSSFLDYGKKKKKEKTISPTKTYDADADDTASEIESSSSSRFSSSSSEGSEKTIISSEEDVLSISGDTEDDDD